MRHAWEMRGKCTRSWWEDLKQRDDWEDRGAGARMGSEWILERLARVCGVDPVGSE
jgi:hypothetical protein